MNTVTKFINKYSLVFFMLNVFTVGSLILLSEKNKKAEHSIDLLLSMNAVEKDLNAECFDYITRLEDDYAKLRKKCDILSNGKPVVFTAYNALWWQTDSTPTIAASGATVYEGSCALSRDFLKVFGRNNPIAYGDTVYAIIPFVVEDTMHERWNNHMDIFMDDLKTARLFGKKQGMLYY